MRAFEELTDFHDTNAAKALWCRVIEDAVFASRRGEFGARQWFECDIWKNISALIFSREEIRLIEDRALSGKSIIPLAETRQPDYVAPMRKYEDPKWIAARAEKKRNAAREQYRLRSGFYQRNAIVPTSQEVAPCPSAS